MRSRFGLAVSEARQIVRTPVNEDTTVICTEDSVEQPVAQQTNCSFCGRSDLGPFAEGVNRAFICYPCVLLCGQIIVDECRRLGIDLPVQK